MLVYHIHVVVLYGLQWSFQCTVEKKQCIIMLNKRLIFRMKFKYE